MTMFPLVISRAQISQERRNFNRYQTAGHDRSLTFLCGCIRAQAGSTRRFRNCSCIQKGNDNEKRCKKKKALGFCQRVISQQFFSFDNLKKVNIFSFFLKILPHYPLYTDTWNAYYNRAFKLSKSISACTCCKKSLTLIRFQSPRDMMIFLDHLSLSDFL